MPVPPKVLSRLQKPNITPISVTRFGQEQIEHHDIASPYIPMAIDTKTYRPTFTFDNGSTSLSGRQLMGLDEDVFVVGLINANKGVVPSRKAWGENILAFSIFAEKHPDARLYLHTERHGNHGGINLDVLIKAVGLQPEQYKFVNQYAFHSYIPNEAMAALYTATDVLLASTLGEGFGLTVLEAQSCGTPVIVNNFSAQPELVGDGWLTEGQPWWDPTQMAWFNTPNVPSIVDSLEQSYARGRGRSEKAAEHAASYDADVVWAKYWRPYLDSL
jgi:glycosyltransferase involved in cell wall biosynthesis